MAILSDPTGALDSRFNVRPSLVNTLLSDVWLVRSCVFTIVGRFADAPEWRGHNDDSEGEAPHSFEAIG